MKKSIYIAITMLACACSQQQTEVQRENPLFSNEKLVARETLYESVDLEKMGIFKPTKVAKFDSLYVVLNKDGRNKLSIYNLDGELLHAFLPTGINADQGLYFLTMNIDREGILTAYDFGNSKLIELNLNDINKTDFGPTFTAFPKEQHHLSVAKNGNTMISTGLFEQGRYCLTNEDGQHFGLSYPETEKHRKIDQKQKSILYASNITKIKPDGKHFVCANMQSGILDIGTIHSNNLINRKIELNLYSPLVSMSTQRLRPVAYSTDNLFGFCDVEVSDEYIYALYSGKSYRSNKEDFFYGRRIVVFDWEGNHIRTYSLPTPFKSIFYNKDENAIYGLTDKPKTSLIKYAL